MLTFRRLAGLVTTALALTTLVAVPARADDNSWTSLYAGTAYEGAGWTNCPQPITISVDTRALDPAQRAKARKAVEVALAKWNRAKVVTFQFGGEIPVRFDRASGVSTPEDGVARDRWIYVTLVKANSKSTSDTAVVGLAGPLRVDPATKAILEASAAFQAQYVNKQPRALVAELFAHELGHVFGLGHDAAKGNVMYPILSALKKLGASDIAGAYALLKPCPAPPPAEAPPAP